MLIVPRKASDSGIAFVKHCEGLRLTAYSDNGIAMGFGTHRSWFKLGDSCTLDQANAWLMEDVRDRQMLINQHFNGQMSQGVFDAMISWTYEFNEKLLSSTLLEKYNSGDLKGAWDELPNWVHVRDPRTGEMIESDGLKKRRWTEQAIWLGEEWQDYQDRNYPALVYILG